ncbi:tRNA lysidine(34) synthetase TilS [Cellulomonas composti]|uniref:tRNA(Ile)-lysidine synthase n=1 Tax=Cellulomonas composti TaxID=266130 RepID=A0A511JC16_9CELL|nr:tRNA lysidine(34) synthetase TilS [Cellulomonas composti]GEL95253.1 tRNA(Ile)-lysidine synthase [Cellulomonas composti]
MPGPAPAVARVRSAVRSALADVPPGALVLVACSGGPDSLALAAAAAFVVPRLHRGSDDAAPARVGAVVVDHGWAPGSDEVAAAAAATCRTLGLDPVHVVVVRPGSAGGPEAAARTARYEALADVAARTGAAAVLLGHTLDDQAETVLLGLARGSGARSLAGMAPRRGLLRRPLLGVPRADTLAACDALGLTPWHDPTNAGAPEHPLRSRVRAQVLPVLEEVLGPGVAAALARSADQLREDADALDAAALAVPAYGSADGSADEVAGGVADGLDVAALAPLPDAVRRRVLRRAALDAGCPAGALRREHVLGLDALVVDWHGQGPVDLPGGRAARRSCGRLVIGPAGA